MMQTLWKGDYCNRVKQSSYYNSEDCGTRMSVFELRLYQLLTVMSSKLFNILEPQSSHLQNGNDNSNSARELYED